MFIPFCLGPNHCCYNLNYSRNKIRCIFQSWLASSGFLLTMAVFIQFLVNYQLLLVVRAMVIAIILFEAGSLMCALANDMNVLIEEEY